MKRFLAASTLALVVVTPTYAHPHDLREEWIAASSYDSKLQRLTKIGWRLARGNADYCANRRMAAGWVLHDALTFDDPTAMARAKGGRIWIAAIVPDGPAARAGLASQDIPVTVGPIKVQDVQRGDTVWQRLIDLDRLFDTTLSSGPARLEYERNGRTRRTTIAGERVCSADFEVRAGERDAIADRRRVMLGEDFVGFDWRDDDTLAAIVAHEFAHVVLGHDSRNKSREDVLTMERMADALMPWLLVNAGYDPAAASRAIAAWGAEHDPALALKRRHDRWPRRVQAIDTEIAEIERWQASGRPLDWRERLAERLVP